MLQLLALVAIGYLAATADVVIAPLLAVDQIAPCLLALVSLVWVVGSAPSPWRVVQAGGLGLLFDLNSGGHFGGGLVAFAVMAFSAGQFRATLRRIGPLGQAVATAPLVAGALVVIAIINALAGESAASIASIPYRAVLVGAYTAIAGLPLWMILDWLRDWQRGLRPLATR